MITLQHTETAAMALSEYNSELLAAGKPGPAPIFTEVYEDDHQREIRDKLLSPLLRVDREVRFPNWANNAFGRVDFLLGSPLPFTVDTSSPVQYKPAWASVSAVVDDLFYLGMWWPGLAKPHTRRAVWYSSLDPDAGRAIIDVFADWLAWAQTRGLQSRDKHWAQLVTSWEPQATLIGSAPIESRGVPIAWIHHVEVTGAGPTPATTSGIASNWPPGWV